MIILLSLLTISACSASYEKLKGTNYLGKSTFNANLLKIYKEKAQFEAEEMHDWNSAKLYAEKALSANEEELVKPQILSYWKLPEESVSEFSQGYDNLMKIYDDAIIIDPYNLAVAISSLDCWAEQQEENWQILDIKKCRDDFYSSLHIIYEKVSIKEKNKSKQNLKNINQIDPENVFIITQNKEKEILQIIYFDFNNHSLSEVSLKTVKNFLLQHNNKINSYIIIGHADRKGTKEYNKKLSLKRAETVKKILISEGIKEKNITVLGKGELFPAVPTKDGVDHPANRRVEIISK